MPLLDILRILIDADGRPAERALDSLGKKTKETLTISQQFGRDFLKGLGIGAGAAGGLAAANALKDLARFSISAAQAAEADAQGQIVLRKTLQNTTGATSEQIRATEDWITTTSRQVGVLDDDLRPALATLVRSTNDVASAQSLLNLALDVSKGTNRDLSTVTQALSKTYEGNTTALGRLVPEVIGLVKEGATAAQQLNRLQRSFGGTAQAAADQAGSFARLRVATDDITEAYGKGFIPTVREAALGAQQLSRILDNQFAGSFAASIQTLVNPLSSLAATIGVGGKSLEKIRLQAADSSGALNAMRERLDRLADGSGRAATFLQKFGFGAIEAKSKADSASSSVNELEAALRALAAAASSAFDSLFGLGSAQDAFSSALSDGGGGGAARAVKDEVQALFELESSARSVLRAQLDLADAEKNLEEIRKGASDRDKNRAKLDTASAENRVAQAQQRIAEATNALNKATGRRGNAADAANARQALADAILEEQRARLDLADTQDRENDTMKRGVAGSEDLADATKKVEDAQWNLREAIESQRQQAMQDQNDGGPVGRSAQQQRKSFEDASRAAGGVVEELVKHHAPLSVIEEAIGRMIGDLNVYADKWGIARTEVERVQEILHGLEFQSLHVPDIFGSAGAAGGRAGGGSINAGSTYTVGERGPETLTMGNSPGWVTPGGGSPTFVFNGPVVADKVTLERMVYEAWQGAQRRGWN